MIAASVALMTADSGCPEIDSVLRCPVPSLPFVSMMQRDLVFGTAVRPTEYR